MLGIFPSRQQFRADYSHDGFVMEARGKYAGRFRRLFDRPFTPQVTLTVKLRDWQPCQDCFAGVMCDVRTRLGAKKLLVDLYEGTVQVKIADPKRRLPLLGDDFDRLAEVLEKNLTASRAENHSSHLLAAV